MARKRKQVCRICKKRQPWKYKNCPPGVCKTVLPQPHLAAAASIGPHTSPRGVR